MSEHKPERRDDLVNLVNLAVDAATIKERVIAQADTLVDLKADVREIKTSMGSMVSRAEYDERHKEIKAVAEEALSIAQDLRTTSRNWRFVVAMAITVLGGVIVYFHHS